MSDLKAFPDQLKHIGQGDNREITDTEATSDAGAEVVISGLSGRLPESDNIAEFREHLINGDDMVTEDNRRWEPGEILNNFLELEGVPDH